MLKPVNGKYNIIRQPNLTTTKSRARGLLGTLTTILIKTPSFQGRREGGV